MEQADADRITSRAEVTLDEGTLLLVGETYVVEMTRGGDAMVYAKAFMDGLEDAPESKP